MELQGKVIIKSEIQTGTSAAGNEWQKLQIVIETDGQYPKKVAFELFGKVVDFGKSLKKNQDVTVHFDVESREWESRWFTTAKAWKVETNTAPPPTTTAPLPPTDDLPF